MCSKFFRENMLKAPFHHQVEEFRFVAVALQNDTAQVKAIYKRK